MAKTREKIKLTRAEKKQLQELMAYYASGTEVEIVVSRANNGTYEDVTLSVTLGSKTTSTSSSESDSSTDSSSTDNSQSTPDGGQSSEGSSGFGFFGN